MRQVLQLLAITLVLSACSSPPPPPPSPAPPSADPARTESPQLPFDPFEASGPDDWSLYATRSSRSRDGRLTRAGNGVLLYVRTPDADDDVVFRLRDASRWLDLTEPLVDEPATEKSESNRVFARRDSRGSLREYLEGLGEAVPAGAVFSDVVVREDTYTTRQGQEFATRSHAHACTRLDARATADGQAVHLSLWLSRSVPALGLVALRLERREDLEGRTLDLELLGHGHAHETRFGTPRELAFGD